MARLAGGVVEQKNDFAERSPSDWKRDFGKKRRQLNITSSSPSAFDLSCAVAVLAIQPNFQTASVESGSVSRKERLIPGLNRSHSDLELQLADLLEEAQLAGSECTEAKYLYYSEHLMGKVRKDKTCLSNTFCLP